jgi:hypothetical protein
MVATGSQKRGRTQRLEPHGLTPCVGPGKDQDPGLRRQAEINGDAVIPQKQVTRLPKVDSSRLRKLDLVTIVTIGKGCPGMETVQLCQRSNHDLGGIRLISNHACQSQKNGMDLGGLLSLCMAMLIGEFEDPVGLDIEGRARLGGGDHYPFDASLVIGLKGHHPATISLGHKLVGKKSPGLSPKYPIQLVLNGAQKFLLALPNSPQAWRGVIENPTPTIKGPLAARAKCRKIREGPHLGAETLPQGLLLVHLTSGLGGGTSGIPEQTQFLYRENKVQDSRSTHQLKRGFAIEGEASHLTAGLTAAPDPVMLIPRRLRGFQRTAR